MSEQPPAPPLPYYPPSPPPQKPGMSKTVKVLIVAVVILAVVLLAVVGASLLQSPEPNIQVTNQQGVYAPDCGAFASNTTTWTLSATLVNTGGRGYTEIAYKLNGATEATNNYFVDSQSSKDISYSFTLNTCQDQAGSTFDIVILSQRPA